MTEPDLETRLRRSFAVRTESFRHRDFAVEMLLPRAADELIDTSEFNLDERLPYWAELWPSARALTRFLLDSPSLPGRVLELGCGVALPSLALRWRGAVVTATDYYSEALDFALANAARNGIGAPATALLDWRAPAPELGRFPLVVAADVLYERRNADALLTLLPLVVEPAGTVLLADPGRVHREHFETELRARGWRVEEAATRDEPSSAAGALSRVLIARLSPPA